MKKALVGFFRSDRNLQSVALSKFNLGLVIGPTSSGKSFIVKKCLRDFEEESSKNQKLIVHVDYTRYNSINFDIFLTRFEQAIIDQIVSSPVPTSILLNATMQSLQFSWKPELLEHLLHRVCSANSFVDEWQLDAGIEERLQAAARSTFEA